MAFQRDERPARCACGYEGTISQIRGHRSRKVYAECLSRDPVYLDEDGNPLPAGDQGPPPRDAVGDGPGDQRDDAGEEREGSPAPSPSARGPSTADIVPPTRTRGVGGRPDVGHINGYTPVRAQMTFPAQLYTYYDFFVGNNYEGTVQDWITEIVLKCMVEHYGLRLGVYVERANTNGASHG